MAKYRKKPVEIEAWQFTKKNFSNGVPEFIRHAENHPVTLYSQYAGEVIYGEIETLEGTMKVSENDWVIKGIQGEFYPCKPEIFEETYEQVEEPKTPKRSWCPEFNPTYWLE